jgi:hypothetical protein
MYGGVWGTRILCFNPCNTFIENYFIFRHDLILFNRFY